MEPLTTPLSEQRWVHFAPYALAVLLMGAAFAVGAWDVAAASSGHRELTVSTLLRDWASEFPVLPFAVGLIIGHIFWR